MYMCVCMHACVCVKCLCSMCTVFVLGVCMCCVHVCVYMCDSMYGREVLRPLCIVVMLQLNPQKQLKLVFVITEEFVYTS